jgi:hypothetical protein
MARRVSQIPISEIAVEMESQRFESFNGIIEKRIIEARSN